MYNTLKTLFLLFFFGLFFIQCQSTEKKTTEGAKIGQTGNPAIDSLTVAIFKQPKNADLYFQRANLFYENAETGGYDYAITDLQYALALDTANTQYLHLLADIYLDYAQSRKAIETVERAVALHPDSLSSLLKLAEIQLITKQYPLSLASLDKVLKKDPNNAGAYFLLGINFREQKQVEKAISAFQKAVDRDADNRDAFIELGNLYAQKKNPLALQYFDNALRSDSTDIHALMAKAVFLQDNQQEAKAIAIYKKINDLDRHYIDAYFNQGILMLEKDSLERAAFFFNICIAEKPTFYKGYYYRGFVAEKQGNKTAAANDYRQALAFSPNYEKAKEGLERVE